MRQSTTSVGRDRPTSRPPPIERDHARVCFAYQRSRRHRPVRRSCALGLRLREPQHPSPAGNGTAAGAAAAADCFTGDLKAEGSSAQKNAIDEAISAFQDACTDANIDYQPTGSGAGIKQFIAKQVDFAGSDSALKTEEKDGAIESEDAAKACALAGLEPAHGDRPDRHRLQRRRCRQARPQRRRRRQDLRRQDHDLERPGHRRAQLRRDAAGHPDQGLLPLRRVGHDRELHEVPQGRRARRRGATRPARSGPARARARRSRPVSPRPRRARTAASPTSSSPTPSRTRSRWPRSTAAPAPSS